jgi:signal transduction histidine kinase
MMLSYVGQKSLQLEEVSFADLVQETVTEFKDDKSLLISLEIIPPEKALYCLVDVPQITEALKSIFTNSIESMGDRSGTIKVSFGTATIGNDSLPLFFQDDSIKIDSYVFCQIEDSGHGVSHENLEHIFDPFYTTRSTGRGLGLALTARIMQTHNGAITIDSIPDESTTVRVLLPSISLS